MRKWYEVRHIGNRPVIIFETFAGDDYDGERPIENHLPARYEVCAVCGGTGMAYSSDLEALDTCPECEGYRCVAVPVPPSNMTKRERRLRKQFLELHTDWISDMRERSEEQRMGGEL